jgi:cobalt/nickel transport system permease protein
MQQFADQFRREHGLSGIDARVKLVSTLLLLGLVLSYAGFLFPLVVLGCCLAGCIYIRVSLKVFLLRFSEPLFIIIMLLFLKIFFTGKNPLFLIDIAGLQIVGYSDGLKEGLLIACRILGAVSLVALLGFSTPFNDIVSALSWLRMPRGLVEILMFAYRYIFLLLEDAMVIYNAQKNRLGYSSIRRGLNSFGILAGSLILKAFESSQSTATAMMQRGYDGNMPTLAQKPFRPVEIVTSVIIIVIMGLVWKI